MNIQEIVVILQNRLINLNDARAQAVRAGSLEQVVSIDADIVSTQNSINTITASLNI